MCFSERVPWEIFICQNSCNYSLRSLVCVDKCQRELFSELTEIADWLFSPRGKDVLVCCRNNLEKLGIISRREEIACIHIHALTLKGVRSIL